ncbi:tRNA endonuclease ANKZF1 isoform X4 [Hemitrygon akajei]|uniref:tRNA endonuclease ANKZF1 isoform X4 n=1 Tax=Hemitrygon akajei TaxID=2704970 RepID=UPI003BFA1163
MIPPVVMATVRPALRVCSVFEASGLSPGLRPAEEAGAPGPAEDTAGEVRTVREPALPEISDRMSCSACGCSFESREEQTEHYRLDWHRFNLRRRLIGAQSVSADNFETIAGEISSISGSDSEELDFHSEPEGLCCHRSLDVSDPGSGISSCEEKPWGRRSTRVLFRTAEGELLSVYRCVLQGKQDIEDLLLVWTEYLQAAGAIFFRAPSHNRGIFLSGKVPALNRGDSRLRSIPFSTRRATFKEVKRVHAALSTVEIYAADTDFTTIHSPQRRVWKKQSKSAEDVLSSDRDECVDVDIDPSDLPTALEVVEETLGTLDLREFEVSPKKKRGKKKKKASAERGIHQEDAAPEINTETDSLPTREKVKGKTQRDVTEVVPADAAGEVRNDLYTACRTGDVERLRNFLCHLLPAHIPEPSCSSPTPDDKCNQEQTPNCGQNQEQTSDSGQTQQQTLGNGAGPSGATVVMWRTLGDGGLCPGPVTTDILNDPVDESGFTLLHVAAAAAQGSVLHLLLDAGCDPACRDKRGRPAYAVSADRDTRNEFRRYMANHPGRYDYAKAQISTPLTCELEERKAAKKQAQKTARKLREKERREEKKRLEEEEMERKMFLALSEREKRALAAEKRFAQQMVSNGAVPVVRRCWLCGRSLAGLVPFEYLDYSFCTTRCLQEHRRQQRL